jgi:hypothetical protein
MPSVVASGFQHAYGTLSAIAGRRSSRGLQVQPAPGRQQTVPIELNSFIKEKGSDRILVRHCFYGHDDAEAEKFKKHHLASCEYYRAAEAEGRTIDIPVEIDELPVFDEAELEAFLEIDDDDDEPDEEEEDVEDPEEVEDEEEE